jgi:hypothetical protein
MIKFILLAMGFVAVVSIYDSVNQNEREFMAQQLAQRLENQDKILVRLEAKNNDAVSRFVADWREAYEEPSPSNLSELRLIEQRINNDAGVAEKFTLAFKMANDPFCNGMVDAVFASRAVCLPGL